MAVRKLFKTFIFITIWEGNIFPQWNICNNNNKSQNSFAYLTKIQLKISKSQHHLCSTHTAPTNCNAQYDSAYPQGNNILPYRNKFSRTFPTDNGLTLKPKPQNDTPLLQKGYATGGWKGHANANFPDPPVRKIRGADTRVTVCELYGMSHTKGGMGGGGGGWSCSTDMKRSQRCVSERDLSANTVFWLCDGVWCHDVWGVLLSEMNWPLCACDFL